MPSDNRTQRLREHLSHEMHGPARMKPCTALVRLAPPLALVLAMVPALAHAQTAPVGAGGTGTEVPARDATVNTATPTPPTPPVVIPVVAPEPPRPPPVAQHDFLDTRLTWTFGDDDVLAGTGQRVPLSPLPRIGDRPQYQLFFDALNSRFAGRENLTHLTLYARAPGFIPRVVTEAALVMRVDLGQLTSGSGNLNQAFYDAGTYLRVQYQTNPGRPADGLSLTFFPFDTDRFRLGYLWDLSWGGNDIFPRRVGGAPGFRLAFDSGPLSLWAGFKTASIVVPAEVSITSTDIDVVRVEETQYAALAGVGIKPIDMFRFDLGAGYFQQGRQNDRQYQGLPVYTFGASARVVINQGLPPSQSIDMMLYRNHPDYPMQLFRQETYTPGAVSWNVSLEGTAIAQNLANIEIPNATQIQPGFAGALQGRIKAGYLGVNATALYRDVAFLLRNVPSFIPFFAIPSEARTTPEFFFAASADYHIPSAHLTPSLIVGMQLPATFSTDITEGTLESQRTLVIRRAGNFSILPPGVGGLPIVSTRLATRWDLSSMFASVFWLQGVYDPNATLLQVDTSGTRQVRVFQAPFQLGFGVTAQARF